MQGRGSKPVRRGGSWLAAPWPGGNDTFIYRSGDGSDFVDANSTSTSLTDTLSLTDLNTIDVTLSRVGNDLMIEDNTTGHVIAVDDQFYSPSYYRGIEQLIFADETVWDRAALRSAAWLRGATGNDTINGSGDDDTFFGDVGNDQFFSSGGHDTFVYRSGDGSDYIDEQAYASTYTDTLHLVDLNAPDVTLARSGSDLFVRGNFTGDTIEMNKQFYSPSYYFGIEQLKFANGTIWSRTDIDNAAGGWLSGTSGNDTLTGAAKSDVILGQAGNDTVSGLAGADLLEGGDGDDILTGGTGDDVMIGGAGDDNYIFAAGDGVYRIDNRDANSTNDRLAEFTDSLSPQVRLRPDRGSGALGTPLGRRGRTADTDRSQ